MTGLRERNKSKRRAAILDATVMLLRDNEFADVTIDQVAALAEVSPHTVYNLVGPRDDLAYAVMGRVIRRVTDPAPRPDHVSEDPSDALRTLTARVVGALVAESAAHRSIVRAVSSLPHWPDDGREPFRVYAKAASLLENAGVLRPGVRPRTVSRHALLGMFGAMMAWARGQTDLGFHNDSRLNLALVLAGTTTGAVSERASLEVVEFGRLTATLR